MSSESTPRGRATMTIDAQGRIHSLSADAGALLGRERGCIVGTPFSGLVADLSRGVASRLLRMLGSSTPTWSTLWFQARRGAVRCLVRVVPVSVDERPALRLEVRSSGGGGDTPNSGGRDTMSGPGYAIG